MARLSVSNAWLISFMRDRSRALAVFRRYLLNGAGFCLGLGVRLASTGCLSFCSTSKRLAMERGRRLYFSPSTDMKSRLPWLRFIVEIATVSQRTRNNENKSDHRPHWHSCSRRGWLNRSLICRFPSWNLIEFTENRWYPWWTWNNPNVVSYFVRLWPVHSIDEAHDPLVALVFTCCFGRFNVGSGFCLRKSRVRNWPFGLPASTSFIPAAAVAAGCPSSSCSQSSFSRPIPVFYSPPPRRLPLAAKAIR